MGGETTPSRAIVQSAGHAYRLIGQRLKDEFHRNRELQLLQLRYTQALITQMAQTAVCNRHHSVDQQLCRWLLLSLDRLSANQLTRTLRIAIQQGNKSGGPSGEILHEVLNEVLAQSAVNTRGLRMTGINHPIPDKPQTCRPYR
jgi:hypothetical protein